MALIQFAFACLRPCVRSLCLQEHTLHSTGALKSETPKFLLEAGTTRMWCPQCSAEVAAEVSSDNRRIHCATCGGELATSLSSGDDPARDAQDLLKRWSGDELLDDTDASRSPITPATRPADQPMPSAPAPKPVAAEAQEGIAPAPKSRPRPSTPPKASTPNFRFDAPHSAIPAEREQQSDRESRGPRRPYFTRAADEGSRPAMSGGPISPGTSNAGASRPDTTNVDHQQSSFGTQSGSRPPTPPAPPVATNGGPNGDGRPMPDGYQLHQAHQSLTGPHFDIQTLIARQQKKRINWTALLGQVLAYAGVALLTVGTALVLGGYFGGPEDYMRTGWLTSTVGQMLLFLGVVTLVSSGMEQTSDEVSERVETLGRHILRIEHYSRIHQMSGGGSAPPPPGSPPPETERRVA